MDDPTTSAPTTPAAPGPTSPAAPGPTAATPAQPTAPARPTAESVRLELAHLRQRATDLRAAADRAEATRYAERGGALDDATREAGAARQQSDTARQQAQRERTTVLELQKSSEELADIARQPGSDVRFAQEMIERNTALERAAEQRAERLERAAEESGARADALDQRVVELRQVTDDFSVPLAIRGAAGGFERAADHLEEKARLLTEAEALEADAARLDAEGDPVSADLYREQVADVRARADAIVPEIPEIDQRIVDAADRAWGDDPVPPGSTPPQTSPVPGQGPAPTPGPEAGPDGGDVAPAPDPSPETPTAPGPTPAAPGAPASPAAPAARAGGSDSDGDGLSDALERQLGTNVHYHDTDADGWSDGIEVAVSVHNPRVREVTDLDPESAAFKAQAFREWERDHGVQPNADSDGDGFADWVEALGGLEKDPNLTADDIGHNLQPLDQFLKSAQDQMGKPYRFGAEVDPTSKEGGKAYDSSELVEWAAKQAGVRDMPDGSWRQYQHLHAAGGAVPVDEALRTKGALVFGFSSDPLASADRPARAYVAISVGNGKVLEVSERTGTLQEVDPGGFYSYGAVIPALHRPEGDLDGDGWSDQLERDAGDDISRAISDDLEVIEVTVDPLGSDAYDPTQPSPGVDPTGTFGDGGAGSGGPDGGEAPGGADPDGLPGAGPPAGVAPDGGPLGGAPDGLPSGPDPTSATGIPSHLMASTGDGGDVGGGDSFGDTYDDAHDAGASTSFDDTYGDYSTT